jgi:apolipoprotein N-acyltransferase
LSEGRHPSPRKILTAILAGILHAMSMAIPWNGQPNWMLQILALAFLAGLLIACHTKLQAGCLGWIFATTWLAGTFWWLFISLNTYAGLSAVLATFSVLLLATVLATYYALICFLYVSIKNINKSLSAIIFGALWMMAEMCRGQIFTGFPWGAAGYAHTDSPFTVFLPWVGVYGLCGVLAWISMTLAQITKFKSKAGVVPLALGAVIWGLVSMKGGFTTSSGQLKVALLQGNIAQDEKFQPGTGVPMALSWYSEQLGANLSELVVAPETAIPLLPQQLPVGYLQALRERYSKGDQAAMIGLPLGSLKEGYTNAIIGLKPGQDELWIYNKHHLVPFGEFIPSFFQWFTSMLNIPLSDFKAGGVGQPSFEWRGQRLAGNICYEDLFGEELGSRFIDQDQAPNVFVNTSNIAWFGNSLAIDQHLAISRIRSIEFERPFVRATNTGATAIIDHEGRVVVELSRHTQGVLLGAVEGRAGHTPYAQWVSRFGLWPLWLVSALIIIYAWRRRNMTASPMKAS